jgi:hypothetical protein
LYSRGSKSSSAKDALLKASFGITLLLVPAVAVAAQMESDNNKIERDSINAAGGLSTSSEYGLEDTVGEVGSGNMEGTLYRIQGGYQQMDEETFVAITSPADVTLSSISGLVGGNTTGTATWTVTTNSSAGYSLSVVASTDPALKASVGGGFFADYTEAGSDPDYAFSIAATDSEFGFTPEGADITSLYRDNGSACNTGSGDTVAACWTDLDVVDKTVAQGSGSNDPTGTATTLRFRAESGASHIQDAGTYSASITVTALAL